MTRTSRSTAAREADAVLAAAADWFDRLQHENPGPETLAAWQQWLAQDPAHRIAFDRLQSLWQSLEQVPPPPLAGEKQRASDRYGGEVSVAEWRSRPPRRAGATAGWRYAAAVLLFVAFGAAGLWPLWQLHRSPTVTVFETKIGEHREVALPDGSTLALGARSLVWIRFEPARREVTLDRGEAFFQVARDKGRPFTVRAGDTSITALGTAFNVRRTGARVQVAVSEGMVKVDPPAAKQRPAALSRLGAGRQVTIDPAAAVPAVVRTHPETATAWRAGRLEYIDEPLKYVVADVNRYSEVEIVIANPALAELRVTGTVFEDDIEGWLQGIGKFMPLSVSRGEDGEVQLK